MLLIFVVLGFDLWFVIGMVFRERILERIFERKMRKLCSKAKTIDEACIIKRKMKIKKRKVEDLLSVDLFPFRAFFSLFNAGMSFYTGNVFIIIISLLILIQVGAET